MSWACYLHAYKQSFHFPPSSPALFTTSHLVGAWMCRKSSGPMVESGAELWAAAAAAVACRYHLSSDSCQMWAPRKVWPICHTNRLYPPLLLPPPGQYVCDINANDNLPGSTVYRQYIRCHLNCQHTTTTPTPTPPSATLARAMFGCPLPAELEAEEEGKGGLAWGLRIGIEVEFRFDQIGGPCAPLFNSSEPHPLRAGTSQSHSAPCTVLRPPLRPSLVLLSAPLWPDKWRRIHLFVVCQSACQ